MASDQKVKGGTAPGTTPVRKRRPKVKVRVLAASAADLRRMPPPEPAPEGAKAKRVAGICGPGRKVDLVAPRKAKPMADELTELEVYVIARLREAGETMALMPGVGGTGDGERLMPLPAQDAIARMDEVLYDWVGWVVRSLDQRMVLSCFISGMSWRSIAERDPLKRSHEGVRKAFLVLVRALALELVARDRQPPKWLLTELTKKR